MGTGCMMTGTSDQGSVTTKTGGMGWEGGGSSKREGTHVYLWLIHADVWQKPRQCCKSIILPLKTNQLKNKGKTHIFI